MLNQGIEFPIKGVRWGCAPSARPLSGEIFLFGLLQMLVVFFFAILRGSAIRIDGEQIF